MNPLHPVSDIHPLVTSTCPYPGWFYLKIQSHLFLKEAMRSNSALKPISYRTLTLLTISTNRPFHNGTYSLKV